MSTFKLDSFPRRFFITTTFFFTIIIIISPSLPSSHHHHFHLIIIIFLSSLPPPLSSQLKNILYHILLKIFFNFTQNKPMEIKQIWQEKIRGKHGP